MIGTLTFEIAILILTLGLYFYMKKSGQKRPFLKMLILFVGVLIFEVMSEPMWRNYNLNGWAYLYHDVSWIITLGWVVIFMVSFLLVDSLFKKTSEGKKFWLYALFITIITTPVEVIMLSNGLRGYAEELTRTLSGLIIPLTSAPIEIILTIPLVAALVIPFYKVALKIFDSE